ncbi:MAG: hypothetical protein ACYDDN_08180, partial [Candidatus Desulforudaceae bacterium]
MKFDEYYRARDILDRLLRQDLCGPVAEDEVIVGPQDYYVCGKLYPRETPVPAEETEGSLLCSNSEGYEVPINLCYSSQPSSMAISFTVSPGFAELQGEADFAWYVPEELNPDKPDGFHKNWRRQFASVRFDIDLGSEEYCQIKVLHPGLEMRVYIQTSYADGAKTLTAAMVNTNTRKLDWNSNCESTFFQTKIVIRGRTGREPAFIPRKPRIRLNRDAELLNLEMLYRHNPTFATGHGCSAGWISTGDYATEIYSESIPSYEVRQMEPARYVRAEIMSFRFLGSGTIPEICLGLEEMAASYEHWIRDQEATIGQLSEEYRVTAQTNLENCRESLSRIRSGIKALEKDQSVGRAFQFMNRAMLLQYQARNISKHSGAESGWYPFQLAFILQEIASVADPKDPYREVVDLLWFPTGGGKTEAYLGLAALTIFLRRIRASYKQRSGAGVAIIMRYTLRLLTLQQFERATALICACELIRRENPGLLGDAEIASGLWVGGSLTPNRRDKARTVLRKIRDTGGFDSLSEEDPNPCQVLSCPWCGTEIKPRHYEVTPIRMLICCPGEQCPFSKGLPVHLVDEDVYEYGPSLVLGTVDKFARITWQPEVGRLFGLGKEWLPPELIIQDELHLISGPLGTITGLYEVVIDELCLNNGVKAKIVSSTATIRHASDQIKSLYGRSSRQFPAQGLDVRNSYFAREAGEADRPTRRYLGILTPGTSGTTRLVRVYSVLIMARDYLKEQGISDEVIDSYGTLTGYFNTLKELGGAVVNILDDVQGYLKYLYRSKFATL